MDLNKRLSKGKTALVLEHPFIGNVAMNMPFKLSEDVPTAATNVKQVVFNPEFCESLNDEELKFLIAHECMHPMLEHNFRRQSRDPRKWNQAADYVINKLLTDEHIGKMPDVGLLSDDITMQVTEPVMVSTTSCQTHQRGRMTRLMIVRMARVHLQS